MSLYWKCQLIGWGLYTLIPIIFLLSFAVSVHISYDESIIITRPVNVFDSFGFYVSTGIKLFLTGIVISHVMRVVIKKMKVLEKPFRQQILYFLVLTVIFSLLFLVIINGIIGGFDFLNAVNFYRRTFLFQAILFTGTFMIWNLVYFCLQLYEKNTKGRKGKSRDKDSSVGVRGPCTACPNESSFLFSIALIL
jgi:hypothetical protein